MSNTSLERRARGLLHEQLPRPGINQTPERFARLFKVGREDLSLAKIIEAHWDAVAILQEAGCAIEKNALYAVWASEAPKQRIAILETDDQTSLIGSKPFCSGAGLVDLALITVQDPASQLILLDLRHSNKIHYEADTWHTKAFMETQTSTLYLDNAPIQDRNLIGPNNWYTQRPGFWQGSVNPAACWAGGAAGLLDYARLQKRNDPHTLAHLGAIEANVTACQAILDKAGKEIDQHPEDGTLAQLIGLKTRHSIEQLCSDTLTRFARAYGPFPLACNALINRRYLELDLFLRQCHAERDLETLGRKTFENSQQDSLLVTKS